MAEHRECDGRVLKSWNDGFRVGCVFGALLTVIVAGSVTALVFVLGF